MRVVAVALTLIATLLQLLLGATHILGSSYRAFEPGSTNTRTLVSATLDRAPAPPTPRSARDATGSQLLLGVLCLAVAVFGLSAIVVLARRRGKRIALALIVAGCVGSLIHLVAASDGSTLTLIAAILLALALGAGLLTRWRPAAAEAA